MAASTPSFLKKGNFSSIFYIFSAFFPYIWPLAGPNIAKRVGRYKNWRGVIDKPILELLTFGSDLDFSGFGLKRAWRRLKPAFFEFIRVLGGRYCLKLTSEKVVLASGGKILDFRNPEF